MVKAVRSTGGFLSGPHCFRVGRGSALIAEPFKGRSPTDSSGNRDRSPLMVMPPSATRMAPLRYEESSEARNRATCAISSGVP